MARIAVVTPCYNADRYIRETIESVKAQDCDDWEYWLVDDGSSDDTVRVVQEAIANDPRIQLVRQANAGVHVARRIGGARVSADTRYIVFLDADDLLAPEFLRRMATQLDRFPQVGMVYCQYVRVGETGDVLADQTTTRRWVPSRLGVRELDANVAETPLMSLVSRHESIPSATLLRRTVYERTAGWRKMGVIEDKDMAIQMALLAPVHFIPDRLTSYRQHDSNRSSTQFYESLKELHGFWWMNADITAAERVRVRRALAFDKRLAAIFSSRAALDRRSSLAPIDRGRLLVDALLRYVWSWWMWGRATIR